MSLAELAAELALMRVRPCGLAHERVLIDAGGVRRRAPRAEHDPGLVRAGLCSHAARAGQLSCAHTRARLTLERAIRAAAAEGILAPDEAQRLQAELSRIDHAIHMTDWDKSRAEVAYAELVEAGSTGALAALQRQCGEFAARHTRLGAELAALHADVLARLVELR